MSIQRHAQSCVELGVVVCKPDVTVGDVVVVMATVVVVSVVLVGSVVTENKDSHNYWLA